MNRKSSIEKDKNITLAILAGGKATRMGGVNKAMIEYDGIPLIKRVHSTLSPLFSEVIIIANSSSSFGIPETKIYSDIIQNAGPLGGIHTALRVSTNPFVFVTSCDLPFASNSIAQKLIETFYKVNPEIIIPRVEERIEPLFGIYSTQNYLIIENLIKPSAGKSVMDLLNATRTFYLDFQENEEIRKGFINVNSLEDLKILYSNR